MHLRSVEEGQHMAWLAGQVVVLGRHLVVPLHAPPVVVHVPLKIDLLNRVADPNKFFVDQDPAGFFLTAGPDPAAFLTRIRIQFKQICKMELKKTK